MQNQCLFFYKHKQWIQINAVSHQNAYKEVFWLKFQGGACPQTVRAAKLCTARKMYAAETEPTSIMMLSHFSGGNPE